ncbi:hypothetical protein AAII07_35300 [Microvirga sp. 0TCS3.31]
MGIVHHTATLSPTKQELVEGWLPSRSWAEGRQVAEYRFDDPAGEVGVETILWRADDGTVLQTPLTYRAAPLDGAQGHLVGTTDHSVLGRRWVYDGCGDPVWAATLVEAISAGGRQAQMFIEQDGRRVDVPPRMQVRGSGSDHAAPQLGSIDRLCDEGAVTVVTADEVEIVVARVVGAPLGSGPHLSGTVGDSDEVTVLAVLRRP